MHDDPPFRMPSVFTTRLSVPSLTVKVDAVRFSFES